MKNQAQSLSSRLIRLGLIVAVFLAGPVVWSYAASVEDVTMMKSAERQKILVEGAKKEGKVVWYTTLIVDQVIRPMKEAFEKEYPFLQVEYFRGNSDNVVQRVIAESQAKRYAVDIVDGSSSPTMLRRAGLLGRFFSPHLAEYPTELKDAQNFWGVANLYFFAVGYNTRMVKPAEVPKTYEDLLNPRWKGQMMWSTGRGAGAPLFVGNILQTMGQEPGKAYLQKLKTQNIAKTTASNRQVLDLVIAGEYPIGLQIFAHHPVISKNAGAPSDWQPLEPLPATIHTIGITKSSPHPHATLLLLDFVLSKRGQKVIQLANYLPSHPEMPALQAELKPGGGRYKRVNYFNPDVLYDKNNEWTDYFQNQFLK